MTPELDAIFRLNVLYRFLNATAKRGYIRPRVIIQEIANEIAKITNLHPGEVMDTPHVRRPTCDIVLEEIKLSV